MILKIFLIALIYICLTIKLKILKNINNLVLVKTNEGSHYISKKLYQKYLIVGNKINKYNIFVVYFINCLLNPNYLEWLKAQINYVINWNVTIYILATCNFSDEIIIKKNINNKKIKIKFNRKNLHEYPGIKKVWELGQTHNKYNDIILYYHSKDITHNDHYKEIKCNKIIKNIDLIKDIFSSFPQVDKIGESCSNSGFIWYNYWFVRGSYINKLERPIITTNRYYYESWLSKILKANNKRSLCYSFNRNKLFGIGNIGFFFDPSKNVYNQILIS